jgi:hypothetical protein
LLGLRRGKWVVVLQLANSKLFQKWAMSTQIRVEDTQKKAEAMKEEGVLQRKGSILLHASALAACAPPCLVQVLIEDG